MSQVSHSVVKCNVVTINFLLTVFIEDDGIPFIRLTDPRTI